MKQLHFLNRFSFPQTCDRRSSRLSQYFLLHYCISRRVGGRGGGTIFLFENFPPFHLSRCIYLVTRRLILEKGETISENGAIASRLPLFPILDHHLVNGYTALYKYTNTQIHKYTITNYKIHLTSPDSYTGPPPCQWTHCTVQIHKYTIKKYKIHLTSP